MFKHLPAIIVSVAALIAAGVFGLGPYSLVRERPPVCDEGTSCVVAMGLDDDVNILFGNPNKIVDFDINDEVTRRLVGWLADAPGDTAVYKYPAEVEIPEQGVPGYDERAAAAIARAVEIGRQQNASLVVIGQVVSDRSVRLAFIDPNAPPPDLRLAEYELPVIGAPARFDTDYAAYMAAVVHAAPPPTEEEAPQTVSAAPPPPAPASTQPAAMQTAAAAPAAPPPSRAAPPPSHAETAAANVARASSTRAAAVDSAYTPSYAPPPVMRPPPVVVPAQLLYDPQAAVRLATAYPRDAMRAHATGDVDVRCLVSIDGSLRDCAVVRNTNPAYSFAAVALEHAQTRRATPETVDGAATDDGVVIVPYRFAVQ